MLLEFYGNCFLRGKYAQYLRTVLIPRILRFFYKDEGPVKSYFSTDLLKYKVRPPFNSSYHSSLTDLICSPALLTLIRLYYFSLPR